jgi:hypothetical protein
MAYRGTLLRDLTSGQALTPIYIAQGFSLGTYLSFGYASETIFTLYGCASHSGMGLDDTIDPDSVSLMGASLTPGTWESTIGGFSFSVIDPSAFRGDWVRGSLIALKMGFNIKDPAAFDTVAVGVLSNISRNPDGVSWTINCMDIVSALKSRHTTTMSALPLFTNAGTETTLAVAYTVTDTTLDLASATGFERNSNGSGTGVVKVTPDSGDDFYLTYTGITSNQLTGVSAAGQFGTTAGAAGIGNAAIAVVYLSGHPLDIVRKIITSTGSASNGGHDTEAASWGYALPQEILDRDDIADYESQVVKVASGSYTWSVLVEAPIDNGFSWMADLLKPAGIFLAMRQGELTVRAVQNPEGKTANLYLANYEITDDDIIEIEAHDHYDASVPVEFGEVDFTTATGTTTKSENSPATVATLPAQKTTTYDLSTVVFDNESETRTEWAARLRLWALRVPERLTVRCHLYMMQATVGDVVLLTTNQTQGRSSDTADGFVEHEVMVTQWDVQLPTDGGEPSVTLVLSVLPSSSQRDP